MAAEDVPRSGRPCATAGGGGARHWSRRRTAAPSYRRTGQAPAALSEVLVDNCLRCVRQVTRLLSCNKLPREMFVVPFLFYFPFLTVFVANEKAQMFPIKRLAL